MINQFGKSHKTARPSGHGVADSQTVVVAPNVVNWQHMVR